MGAQNILRGQFFGELLRRQTKTGTFNNVPKSMLFGVLCFVILYEETLLIVLPLHNL
jgi:hypothetical protein